MAQDVRLLFSDKVKVKFTTNSKVNTMEGRWQSMQVSQWQTLRRDKDSRNDSWNVCSRSDEKLIAKFGKSKAFLTGSNSSCWYHACQHYELYQESCKEQRCQWVKLASTSTCQNSQYGNSYLTHTCQHKYPFLARVPEYECKCKYSFKWVLVCLKWVLVCLKWVLVCLKWVLVCLKWVLVCLKWVLVCLKWVQLLIWFNEYFFKWVLVYLGRVLILLQTSTRVSHLILGSRLPCNVA